MAAEGMALPELALERGFTQLFEAVDTRTVSEAKSEAKAEAKSEEKAPAAEPSSLHKAIEKDNYALVETLLKRYPVNIRDKTGQTPLMYAAQKGNKRIVELLLTAGADPNLIDREGMCALHHAIEAGDEATALLLFSRTKVHHTPHDGTSLHMAAEKGLLSVVRCACEMGLNKQAVDSRGYTALHVAAIAGKSNIITYLVQEGCPIDHPESPTQPAKIKSCHQRTALHLAARHGHVDAVQCLLSLGADPEKPDRYGRSLCEYAVRSKKRVEMLQFIEQLPAYHSKNHEMRLLHAACMANNLQVLSELILAHDVNLNAQSEHGLGALHFCALNSAGDAAEALLAGGDMAVDLPDLQGNTPLHYAAQEGDIRIMTALIRAGADLNVRNVAGATPLFLACQAGHRSAVIQLLEQGASSAISDRQGRKPIDIAKQQQHHEVVACFSGREEKASAALQEEESDLPEEKLAEAKTEFPVPLVQPETAAPVSVSTPVFSSAPVLQEEKKEEKKQSVGKAKKPSDEQIRILLAAVDFRTFQKQSQHIVLEGYSAEIAQQWRLCCAHIDHCQASNAEKLVILKIAFQCIHETITASELTDFIDAAFHLKKQAGTKLFYQLFCRHPMRFPAINRYQHVLELLSELHASAPVLTLVETHLPRWGALYGALKAYSAQHIRERFPQRELKTTLERFSQVSLAVNFPLSQAELAAIGEEYQAVQAELKSLQSLPLYQLRAQAKTAAAEWEAKQSPQAKAQLVAIIAETIYRSYGIYPHDTQLLALLGILHFPKELSGRIAQIKTGEGKSMMIAMLAAFCGLQQQPVDIVTSSDELAIRDSEKYTRFYRALGLQVSHICYEDPEPKHFNAHIIYGTGRHFEFTYLRDGLRREPHRKNPYGTVIVDEADNLFLRSNASIISAQHPENYTWIYPSILAFVKQGKPNETMVTQREISALREYLLREHAQHALRVKQLQAFSDTQLRHWLYSAKEAWFVKKKDRDYVVKVPHKNGSTATDASDAEEALDIVIVDRANTGRFHPGSEWQHGLHQFLQCKENLPITPETLAIASISPVQFFNNFYRRRFGLTGSVGTLTESKEIELLYGMGRFDVPPHCPDRRAPLEVILEYNPDAYNETLLTHIRALQQAGRPVLVLFESIEASETFSRYAKASGLAHQVLNENQRETESYVIARAGLSGMVTLATNTAGRGTDILLSPDSIQAGGLEVVFTFYPENLRVEVQGLGRSARQGQPGSGSFVLNMQQDEMVKILLKGMKVEKEEVGIERTVIGLSQKVDEKKPVASSAPEIKTDREEKTVGTLDEESDSEILKSVWKDIAPVESRQPLEAKMDDEEVSDVLRDPEFLRALLESSTEPEVRIEQFAEQLQEKDEDQEVPSEPLVGREEKAMPSLQSDLRLRDIVESHRGNILDALQDESSQRIVSRRVTVSKATPKDLQPLEAKTVLALLDELRTERTKDQSQYRQLLAAKEMICFEKLQWFFAQLKTVQSTLNSPNFDHAIQAVCRSSQRFVLPKDDIGLVGEQWRVVQTMALNLYRQQQRGTVVDWSVFIAQFKKCYEEQIKMQWALFYTDLQNQLAEIEDLAEARSMAENQYLAIQKKLEVYCKGDVPAAAVKLLHRILAQAQAKLTAKMTSPTTEQFSFRFFEAKTSERGRALSSQEAPVSVAPTAAFLPMPREVIQTGKDNQQAVLPSPLNEGIQLQVG